MKPHHRRARFLSILLLTVLSSACAGGGAGGTGPEYIDWTPHYAEDPAVVSSAWGTPELVSASTPGWEEGIYISPDGNTLYFIYTDVDVFRLAAEGEQVESGPLRDPAGNGTRWVDGGSRTCGEYPYADQFYVTRTGDNQWSAPQPHFLTTTRMESVGGIHLIESDSLNRRMAYVMSGFGDGIDSIHYAYDIGRDGWDSFHVPEDGNPATDDFAFDAYIFPVDLGEDAFEDADPWVNDAGTLMFFWSDRDVTEDASDEGKNIYYSINPDNGIDTDGWATPAWSAPVKLPAPVNTAGDEMQSFVHAETDGDYLYYATNRGHEDPGMSYEIAIYRVRLPVGWEATPSLLDTESNWGTPERVIHSGLAVGEPTLTADGAYLYFEQIFHDGAGNFNPEILRVGRLP